MFKALAILPLLLVAAAQDMDPVSEYCLECQGNRYREHWDLCPDMDGDCHYFYQCLHFNESHAIGYRMNCPEGTFFHEDLVSCMPEGDVPCKDPCQSVNITTPGCFALPDRCSQFWICTEASEAFSLCCPKGTSFNTTTCNCEHNEECTDACYIKDPSKYQSVIKDPLRNGTYCIDSYGAMLKPSIDGPQYFNNIDSEGSTTRMICPTNTKFSFDKCRCEGFVETDDLPSTPARQCSLYLPFDTDYKDYSINKFYTEVVDEVEIDSDSMARGAGSLGVFGGKVEIPAMTRNNIGALFSQCFFYRCYNESCPNGFGGLISNNENSERTKFTFINSAQANGNFVLQIMTADGVKELTVPTANHAEMNNETNGFVHICITFSPSQTKLYMNMEQVGTIYGAGPQFGSHAPLAVGKDPTYGPYTGFIDEVLVCPYELTAEEMEAHYSGREDMEQQGMIPKVDAPEVKYTYLSINTTESTCGHTRYWNHGEDYDTLLQLFNTFKAAPNEFPWMVALFSEEYNLKAMASIIDSEWMLTTASTFLGNGSEPS